MNLSADLDRRFREAAARSGLLDVAYDLTDSPVGKLFLATTARGLCRIAFEPESEVENVARTFGARVLRAPSALDPVKRQLDEYFTGERTDFDLRADLSPVPEFQRRVLEALQRIRFGELTTYGKLAEKIGAPRAARAVGGALNRNPVPIVVPCHRVIGASGSLVGYAGGLDRKRTLLELEHVIEA